MSPLTSPVTVVDEADSGLVRQRWVFTLIGDRLVLDRYHHERRYSQSQNYQTTKFFDRQWDGTEYGEWQWLTAGEVPWDDELKTQALAELVGRIEVQIT
jgi:hypothetical protein